MARLIVDLRAAGICDALIGAFDSTVAEAMFYTSYTANIDGGWPSTVNIVGVYTQQATIK